MIEALQFEFMQNAIIAGLLACVACGIIGSLVVVNRIVFISGGVAHAAYGGIGLAFYFGFPPLWGAGIFAVVSSLIMGEITLRNKHRADTIIGVLWAVGMAFGIILIDLTPGYNVDLMSYLFGSILLVPDSDIVMMILLDLIIIITVGAFYKNFLAMSYDEEFASLRGISVRVFYFILLALVALTVVMTIRVVGLILVIALLTIPTFIAEKFANSLSQMMLYAFALSAGFTLTGLWLSYTFNITSGATIIMVGAALFFVFNIAQLFKRR